MAIDDVAEVDAIKRLCFGASSPKASRFRVRRRDSLAPTRGFSEKPLNKNLDPKASALALVLGLEQASLRSSLL